MEWIFYAESTFVLKMVLYLKVSTQMHSQKEYIQPPIVLMSKLLSEEGSIWWYSKSNFSNCRKDKLESLC